MQNDKNHKLFDKYACQKEKDVLQYNQVKRKGAGNDYVGIRIMWALGFVPLVIMFYLYHTQRVKKLENKIKRIEQKQKGNKEMSRLLKELIGKTPTIVGQVFGTDNWEVVDVDEEWVKLRRVDKKGKEKFKLQRIEDIQTVEFDGK